MNELPRHKVMRVEEDWDWSIVPALAPFTLADGSGLARQQTKVRVCHDGRFLRVRFDCQDKFIWGNHVRRDDPLYEEEAVEIFIAPGEADPERYFEFEFSPYDVLWDGIIDNPALDGTAIHANTVWNCQGIHWNTQRNDTQNSWHVWIALPLKELAGSDIIPPIWRANFFRIDRPNQIKDDRMAEFSCWSPTFTSPASFHQPRLFGTLELE